MKLKTVCWRRPLILFFFLLVQPVYFATTLHFFFSRWGILVWKTSTEYFRVCQFINEAGPGSSPEDRAGRVGANIICTCHKVSTVQKHQTIKFTSRLPALTLQVQVPDCDLYHGKIKYQHSVSIAVIQSSLALSLLCTSYFLIPSIRPTPGDTPAHEPQELFFFFLSAISSSLKLFSACKATHAPSTTYIQAFQNVLAFI